MFLSKESILKAHDLKREVVDVPEWGKGAKVIVGELSALDRLAFSQFASAEENQDKHYIASALTFFLINEDGSKMFTPDDYEALGGKSLDVLQRIFDAAQRVNVIGPALAETVKK